MLQMDGELMPAILDITGCRAARQISPVDVNDTSH